MGNPGVDQNYTIEKGYRYFDLLVVGGGGGGGTNSGGGGASGTIALARNIKISGRSKPPFKHLSGSPCFDKIYRW